MSTAEEATMPELIDITIPALGESVAEATIAKWPKADGDFVGPDDVIAELETDKATIELPAGKAGAFKPLAKQGAHGEGRRRRRPHRCVRQAGARGGAGRRRVARCRQTRPGGQSGAACVTSVAARVVDLRAMGLDDLSPAVRTLVVESKLQSSQIPATGPGGRLTKEDVLTFLAQRGEAETAARRGVGVPADRRRSPPPRP